nr:ficolin-2-like [Leptinotarsa decemlineata]
MEDYFGNRWIITFRKDHGHIRDISPGLHELDKTKDNEFILTKLFDIRLEGGYENLHPDLQGVIQSQVHPEVNFSRDRSLDNKLLKKLENITASQRPSTSDFTMNCQYLVGVDKQSLFCDKLENVKKTFPKSCKEIQQNGNLISGVYEIELNMAGKSFMVLCDMETMGGGWTHIQRRLDGSQDFFLGWREYKFGFGNLKREFWMGLENIHLMTGSETNELLVEIVDRDDIKAFAHYKEFAIGSEKQGYSLRTLKNYSGDAGDPFTYHLGSKFTTKDFDQDSDSENCAIKYCGAWWYKSCHTSNLNGKYLNAILSDPYNYKGLHWNTFRDPKYSHAKARMLIRPKI